MTIDLEPIPPEAADAIERVRGLTRKLAAEVVKHGVEPVDIALGVGYGLHDLALELTGSPMAAIEWQRTLIDLAERGHITGGLTATFKGDGQG